jgi:hypothetical protein
LNYIYSIQSNKIPIEQLENNANIDKIKVKRKRTPAKNRQIFNYKSYKVDINKYDENGMILKPSSSSLSSTTTPSQPVYESDINLDNPERSLDGMEIGENILQKLGWKKGNKLGKTSDKPANAPIQVIQRISRAGLGLNNSTVGIVGELNNNNNCSIVEKKFERQYQNQKRYNDSRNFEKILDIKNNSK